MATFNLEDLFTADNEEKGVWVEPIIDGEGIGIELLLTGPDTDENAANAEHYKKQLDELEKNKDPIDKAKKRKDLDAKRVAQFVKGIRAANGSEVLFNGKSLEYSIPLIETFFLKAPLVQQWVLQFVFNTANFMKRKKN
jgi:hypothetical protein